MAKQYYDRYNDFRVNNTIKSLPYIKIPEQSTDITIQYKSRTRLDIVSQTYYGTPYYGWLILQANPGYSMEFDIPDGAAIRVPFPLTNALQSYSQEVSVYNSLYKINS
jgi:hypothetical protein